MMSFNSSIGTGEYPSSFVKPRATVLRAASTRAWLDSNSPITPKSGLEPWRVGMMIRLDLRLRQERPHLEHRNHRHEPHEQEEQREEQPDRAEVGQEIPARRVIHAPR